MIESGIHELQVQHGHEVLPQYPRLVHQDQAKIVEALMGAVAAKDSDTGRHLYRTSVVARACLELINRDLAEDEDVDFGFLLHDVGKIGIPDSILQKVTPLSEDEWAVMKQHPQIGLSIVAPIGFGQHTLDVIGSHHERWDGKGYPHGLSGPDIPLVARVFAVADTFDAMTRIRPYRTPLSKLEALKMIALGAGKQFDPQVVRIFLGLTGAPSLLR